MSVEELERELSGLDDAERHRIMAYLVSIEDQKHVEYMEKMARKIDDKDPSHWITLEELEKRLGLGKYDKGE
jgi:hypothetical protein